MADASSRAPFAHVKTSVPFKALHRIQSRQSCLIFCQLQWHLWIQMRCATRELHFRKTTLSQPVNSAPSIRLLLAADVALNIRMYLCLSFAEHLQYTAKHFWWKQQLPSRHPLVTAAAPCAEDKEVRAGSRWPEGNQSVAMCLWQGAKSQLTNQLVLLVLLWELRFLRKRFTGLVGTQVAHGRCGCVGLA